MRVVAAIDAQRGDLFSASFRRDEPGGTLRREGADRIISAKDWVDSLPEGAFIVCPTPERIASDIPEHVEIAPEGLARPDGSVLLAMAAEAVSAGTFDDPWRLEPHYLRRSAAEEKRDAAEARP